MSRDVCDADGAEIAVPHGKANRCGFSKMHESNIIFALDGTLIDSGSSILMSLDAAFRSVGVEPVRSLGRDLVGPPLAEILDSLCDRGVNHETRNALAAAFKDHYDERGYKEAAEFDGVSQVLCALVRQGKKLFLATNKRIAPTRKILEHFEWCELFSEVYTVDVFGRTFSNKTETVSALLRDRAMSPDSAIYVGDRADDYVAAKANGVRFVMAEWGYGDRSTEIPLGISKPRDLLGIAFT